MACTVPRDSVTDFTGLNGSDVLAMRIAEGRCGSVAVATVCSGEPTGHSIGLTGCSNGERMANAHREAGVAERGIEHVRRPEVRVDESCMSTVCADESG